MRRNKCYQKVAHPHHCHRGPKLSRVHWVLLPVYPQVCTDCLAPAWLDIWQNTGKKKATITWNNRCLWLFNGLKDLCTTAPILAYTDFTKPFKLHTNACGPGLGLSSTRSRMTRLMLSSPMPVGVWPRPRPIIWPTNWINQLLTFIPTTVPWPTSWLWQSWMLWFTAGWPVLSIITFNYTTGLGGPTLMRMSCQGWPGTCVHPTFWAHTFKSL